MRLRKHMPLQGIQKLSFRRVVETGDNRVECVKLVKIPMPADRWARATVAGAFPVIEALYRSSWQATRSVSMKCASVDNASCG